MKARTYIFILSLLVSLSGYSQKNYWTISGIVLENQTTPVPFANVFINNTSIGTTTSENGNFKLNIPDRFQQIELVISFVGYKTIKRKIVSSSEVQVFKFHIENSNILNEVVVKAKHDKEWRKKWRIFENAIIGDSKFARDCKILNPEVVKLEYDKNKKVIASAQEPIIIKNNALGFRILFQMDKFESDGTTSYYSGLKFFEKMDTSSTSIRNKWDKNQKDIFSDSFRSFLVALSLNKLAENDFEVFKMTVVKNMYYGLTTVANEVKDGALIPCEATQICIYDKETNTFFIKSEYPLLVFAKKRYQMKAFFADYPYKYSQIVLPKGYSGFTENGWLSRPNGIVLKNYWGLEGFSNMLPDDYNTEGLMIEEALQSNMAELKPIAKGNGKTEQSLSIDAKPLPKITESEAQGIKLEKKNEIANKEESREFKIATADYTVQIKESDNSFSVFELLRRIPGLRVGFNSATGRYSIAFVGSNTGFQQSNSDPTPALVLDGNFISDGEQVLSILGGLAVRDIKELGAIRYGSGAAYGARGANGTIIITTVK